MTELDPQDWILIGRIVSPQGLHGELRVYSETDFPERFLEPGDRWLRRPNAPEPERVELVAGRLLPNKDLYVIRLADIDDRDQAEQLRQAEIFVAATERLPLDEGEFHVMDLVGLTVIDQTQGEAIGTVVDVLMAGNDLLEVALNDSAAKVLIPFVYDIVPVVDLEAQRIEIIPPPGLLDLKTEPKPKKEKRRRTRTPKAVKPVASLPNTAPSDG